MNYADNPNATGLDLCIKNVAKELEQLPWLTVIWGRSFSFKTEKNKIKPYCYSNTGDYVSVLPDDRLKAQCFFKCKAEENINFDFNKGSRRNGLVSFEREMSIIFWLNLNLLDYAFKSDFIYTERLKEDVAKVLKRCTDIIKIKSYIDEDSKKVFDGYDLDDIQRHFLMHPFAGFRIDFTFKYTMQC